VTDFMSSLKPAWHLERIAKLRAGENIVPTHLQLIISDLCNQDCHFCAYRSSVGFSVENFPQDGRKNPVRFIPTPKALEILDDYAEVGGVAVEFTGGGEPTVHPDHLEIIGHAQALGLATGLVTNGVRLREHEAFHALDWLRISLDAGTPETYQRVRKSAAWPQVMRNLKLAARLRRPRVGVGFVVTRENYQEIGAACAIVRDAGIPYVRVSAMFSTLGASYYEGLDVQVPASVEGLQIVNCFPSRIGDLVQGPPDYDFCGYQQFVLYVGGDQKVYTCCTNAYTTAGEIGDLKGQRFKDWLASYDRRGWNARSCHHCQFNDKNRLVNFLLDPAPEHVGFV
jgi:MoaA/NifB/PqqE/SkfB family radical SAM enzyme